MSKYAEIRAFSDPCFLIYEIRENTSTILSSVALVFLFLSLKTDSCNPGRYS